MAHQMTIAIVVLAIIVAAGLAWYQGWLNGVLPESWQHSKSGFTGGPASQINPAFACFASDDPLAVNMCGRI
jgi:flagellar basal body-associated protein FliL